MLCSINIFSPAPIKGKYSTKYHKDPRNLTILISIVIHCVAIQKLFSIKHSLNFECTRIYSPSQSNTKFCSSSNSLLPKQLPDKKKYKKNPLVHDYLSKFIITEKAQSHYLFIKVIGKHFNRKINNLLGNAGLC